MGIRQTRQIEYLRRYGETWREQMRLGNVSAIPGQMYDSVSASTIPPGAEIVAGYVDGLYAWSPADWQMFSGAQLVRIAVFAHTNDGQVLDVEPGNDNAQAAVSWVTMRRAAGQANVTVYCPQVRAQWCAGYSWPDCVDAFNAAGVAQPCYWVANYNGVTTTPAGAVAHQYLDPGPYDLSVVLPPWPGGGAPAPTPEVTDMQTAAIQTRPSQLDVFQVSGGQLWHKWLVNGQWSNENVGSAASPALASVTFTGTPRVAVHAGQVTVTVEDTGSRVWYFAQDLTGTTWGVNELP